MVSTPFPQTLYSQNSYSAYNVTGRALILSILVSNNPVGQNHGMKRYTFPTVVCQSLGWVNLGEILKFAGQNSYSERGACNWFYA